MQKHFVPAFLACIALVGCPTTPPAPTDGGTDAGIDASPDGGPARIEDFPVAEDLALPGLHGAVEVAYDDRGIPHIYGTTLHDVHFVQGYLMSRDRFAQMEFIRRNVVGRLAEVAGNADPGLVAQDMENLTTGYRHNGEVVYEALRTSTDPVDIRTLAVAQAFVDGINLYIDRVMATPATEDPYVLGGEGINLIVLSEYFGHWRIEDVFAMARFQAASLSYDAGADTSRTRTLAAVQATFGGAADPRRGLYADLYSDFPARRETSRDGFNNEPTDMGTSSLLPDLARPRGPRFQLPPVSSLEVAQGYFDRMAERFQRLGMGDEHRGSNNWLVGGSLSASGHPILSNDPHLSLISPPIWWYCHLNTARMGGELDLDVQGVAFAGLPGVVLGFNRHIAWGATTTGYDVTDVYLEQITEGTGGAPDTVAFDADGDGTPAQVAIIEDVQTLHVAGGADVMFTIERVPHHGTIIPGTRTAVEGMPGRFTALSVRYTGDEPSNELAYFTQLATSSTVEEAQAAQAYFEVGSQNFIVIDTDSMRWSSRSRVPVRDPRAMTFAYDADGVVSGYTPLMVLPGTGEYEWTGDLDPRFIPHDQDVARGWIATANQDNNGVTLDGNPCNDAHYLGGDFDLGWREHQIQARLTELATRGDITTADMIELQAATRSTSGEALRDPIVAILESPLDAVPDLTTEQQTRLADARTRLMAWSLETPHGVGATAATEIADSVATTIFVNAISRIIPLALADETDAMGRGVGSAQGLRWLEWALTDPTLLMTGDVLWDDLTTDATVETRDELVVRGVLAALTYLDTRLGTDVNEWRWGRLHTVRFESVLPIGGTLSIPPDPSTEFPDGFPRHGDYGAVDVGNFGLWNTTNFSHGSGASQRLVVEMTDDGPLAFNALPGGQRLDPTSPHHADEAAHWIANEQPPLAFHETDVVAHLERRVTFHP